MAIMPTPDTGFTPRKEFLKDVQTTNSFCLLTLSSTSFIRLYSFPLPVVTSLRRLFDLQDLTQAFREDTSLNFCEFTIDGKPWASPKTVISEKLLVDIFAVLYQNGHSFLSTIDYGREHDDRLAIAFSKPAPSPSTPHSPPASPIVGGSGCLLPQRAKRVPWALSFASATLVRVICPPLHSTPAILQAVRGAWPRGVVSEKKVGDASYEFKLKGYKWFQEDTFATDSLRHILSLLSSLDAYAFSLLASVSLTNRSRVKDLWIFTGPAPVTSEQGEISASDSSSAVPHNILNPELRWPGQSGSPESPQYTSSPTELGLVGVSQRKRFATAPAGGLPHFPQVQDSQQLAGHHVRAATENSSHPGLPPSSVNQLGGPHQKATTRTQLPGPLATKGPGYRESDHDGHRAKQASGRNGSVIYATGKSSSPTSPRHLAGRSRPPSPNRDSPRRTSSPRPQSPLRSSSSPKQSDSPPPHDKLPTPPLLGAGVFAVGSAYRNSELSSNMGGDVKSCEIPIAWTGDGEGRHVQDLTPITENPHSPKAERISVGPLLPGGWSSTPEEEQPTEAVSTGQDTIADATKTVDAPLQDIDTRVASPELTLAELKGRKSQAASVGFISAPAPPASVPREKDKRNTFRKEGNECSNQGWVLVNVEGKGHKRGRSSGSGPPTDFVTVPTPKVNEAALGAMTETSKAVSLSPAAKAIVIVDAVEAKKEKAKPSGVRRFFTKMNRKATMDDETSDSAAPMSRIGGSNGAATSGEKDKESPKPKAGVRGKLRRGSTD